MKNTILTTVIMLCVTVNTWAQIGIGTETPDASAILEVSSTTKGVLFPRMTLSQRGEISNPVVGLVVFVTDYEGGSFFFYTGTGWKVLSMSDYVDPIFDSNGVEYKTVTSTTGAVWLDRNLGASQVATSIDDTDAYGGLFQWGRNADGHEDRISSTSVEGPVVDGTQGSNFISVASGDWLSTSDNTRWNGASKGTEDPCPSGYRVPTATELEAERVTWSENNLTGAFDSLLKLPSAGVRHITTSGLSSTGSHGRYWSSTASDGSSNASNLHFYINTSSIVNLDRGWGLSIRCIAE